jgi:hypothetical protein
MSDLHNLGFHANSIAKATSNERMQAILQWVGVGSVVLMGLAATSHLVKDVCRQFHEPYPKSKHKELLDELDRHYSRGQSR